VALPRKARLVALARKQRSFVALSDSIYCILQFIRQSIHITSPITAQWRFEHRHRAGRCKSTVWHHCTVYTVQYVYSEKQLCRKRTPPT